MSLDIIINAALIILTLISVRHMIKRRFYGFLLAASIQLIWLYLLTNGPAGKYQTLIEIQITMIIVIMFYGSFRSYFSNSTGNGGRSSNAKGCTK